MSWAPSTKLLHQAIFYFQDDRDAGKEAEKMPLHVGTDKHWGVSYHRF